jgi:hypothetical protein
MSSPRSLRWQLNAWTLIAVAVFMFGVAMLANVARDGADAIGWALIVGITLGSAAAVSWLVSLRTRSH